LEMLCRRGMANGAFASAGLVRQGRGRLILEIDISELLPVAVPHDEAGVVEFFNRPGWREAARGDGNYCLFFVDAGGGAGRITPHGSDFFSASGRPLIVDW